MHLKVAMKAVQQATITARVVLDTTIKLLTMQVLLTLATADLMDLVVQVSIFPFNFTPANVLVNNSC